MSRLLPLLLLLGLFALPVQAETLLIEAIEQAPSNDSQGLLRPRRGERMATVETRFGRPDGVMGPIGEPPISRWDYPGFSVFFEHDTVIDTVVQR